LNASTRARSAPEPIARFTLRTAHAVAAALAVSAAASTTMAAAPDAHGAGTEITMSRVDHSPWDALLQRYVRGGGDGVNRFDYAAVEPADRVALDRYLSALQAIAVA
jgi:hypothetical protein